VYTRTLASINKMKTPLTILCIFLFSTLYSQNKRTDKKILKDLKRNYSAQLFVETLEDISELSNSFYQSNPELIYYEFGSLINVQRPHEAKELQKKLTQTPKKFPSHVSLLKQCENQIKKYDSLMVLCKSKMDFMESIQASNLIVEAMIIDNVYTEAYFQRASNNMQLMAYEEVINDCNYIISIDSMNLNAYFTRGLANYSINQFKSATIDFKNCNKITPSPGAFYNLALIKLKLKDYEKGIREIDKGLSLDPNSKDLHKLKARILETQKHYTSAIKEYTYLLNKETNQTDFLINRASLYTKVKEYDLAYSDYALLCSIDNKNPSYQFWAGYCHSINRHYDGKDSLSLSLQYFNRAVELDSKNSDYYYERALVRKFSKDRKGALDDLNKAIQLKPSEYKYYHERNTCHFLLNTVYRIRKQHLYEGINTFNKIEVDSAEKHLKVARLYRLIYDFTKSKQYRDTVFSHLDSTIFYNPNYVEAYHEKGTLFRWGMQDFPSAIEQFKKAIKIDPMHLPSILHLGWTLKYNEQYEESYDIFLNAKEHFPKEMRIQQGIDELKKKLKR
jgi:tetratricopeptide (TPR) repeat protein